MFIVKIGDFGLSHDVSESDYYRPQDKGKPLPVKWMAIEVLSEESRYTTKSDVVSIKLHSDSKSKHREILNVY